MVRVKKGKTARRHRKRLLKHAKGFRWGRKSKYRLAKQALQKAWTYAYRDRRRRKREKRAEWQMIINAAARQHGLSYSKFIYLLKKSKIELDRKILAQLAQDYPDVFSNIVSKIK